MRVRTRIWKMTTGASPGHPGEQKTAKNSFGAKERKLTPSSTDATSANWEVLSMVFRIIIMSPWKTVGLHVPTASSSSSAVRVLNMEESRRTVHTKQVQVYTGIYMYILVCTYLTISCQMISCLNLYSSTPLRN